MAKAKTIPLASFSSEILKTATAHHLVYLTAACLLTTVVLITNKQGLNTQRNLDVNKTGLDGMSNGEALAVSLVASKTFDRVL